MRSDGATPPPRLAGRPSIRPVEGRQCDFATRQQFLGDAWRGTTHRDSTLRRWAADLQNDFRARLDWCVKPVAAANHPPVVRLNGRGGPDILHLAVAPGATVELTAVGTSDPDGHELSYEWSVYPEAGTYRGEVSLAGAASPVAAVLLPGDTAGKTVHVLLTVRDSGTPALARYRRAVVTCEALPRTGRRKRAGSLLLPGRPRSNRNPDRAPRPVSRAKCGGAVPFSLEL